MHLKHLSVCCKNKRDFHMHIHTIVTKLTVKADTAWRILYCPFNHSDGRGKGDEALVLGSRSDSQFPTLLYRHPRPFSTAFKMKIAITGPRGTVDHQDEQTVRR